MGRYDLDSSGKQRIKFPDARQAAAIKHHKTTKNLYRKNETKNQHVTKDKTFVLIINILLIFSETFQQFFTALNERYKMLIVKPTISNWPAVIFKADFQ